jgi:hypothetical protein
LKWPKSDVNSISQDWRQYRFALFDNSVPAGHNSSPFSIERQLRLLVHAARNLMQERAFCHRVVVVKFGVTLNFVA